MNDHDKNSNGYEKRDASSPRIIISGVIGIVVVIAVIIFVNEIFTTTSEKMKQDIILAPQAVAIRELRARETEELNTYKLLDIQNGIYRIPINRAIELMADEAYRNEFKKTP